MTELTINIDTWLKYRELEFCPKHFVAATTPLTEKGKLWVLERLHGRFYIMSDYADFFEEQQRIYFEDPQEAVFYELTWS